MINKFILILLVTVSVIFSACKKDHLNVNFTSAIGSNTDASVSSLQNLDISTGTLGIIELPSSVDQSIRNTFKWYTKVMAPNGKPIHLLAQNQWTEEQMAYARSVMEHYLTNIPNIAYGDKTEVANAIANANGAMTMFNSKADRNASVTGQDLQAIETVAVGTADYISGNVRNAAFEEILHFVHDYGLVKAYPNFQKELEAATVPAMNNQLFIPWGMLPVADYDNEYLASLNDAYWGLTEHNSNSTPYLFLSREACEAGDQLGTTLMKKFLPEYFTSVINVSASFSGDFYLTKKSGIRYTNESQYYKDVTLLGTANSNLYGNKFENYLTGNAGDNELEGGLLNDTLNGQAGIDIAVFSGNYLDYTITSNSGHITIIDANTNRDGTDVLINMEKAKFNDQTVDL